MNKHIRPAILLFALLAGGVLIGQRFPQTTTLVAQRHQAFKPAAATSTLTLSYAPMSGTVLLVYRNGLLQDGMTEYRVSSKVVTFQPALQAGDIVQVVYWAP